MKRLLLLLPLLALVAPLQAEAQVPRTVLGEMFSSTT